MSRYIDAEYDLHKLPFYYDFSDDELIAIRSALKGIPTADVVEVACGEWEECEIVQEHLDEPIIDEWQSARCSVCGKYHTTPYMYYFDHFNFCPNCGADMRGGTE